MTTTKGRRPAAGTLAGCALRATSKRNASRSVANYTLYAHRLAEGVRHG